MSKAEQVFEKLAFNVTDFENRYLAGAMLSDSGETKAKKMYATEKNKRFALKHPWLTGIPSLGLAPAIVAHDAKSDIARKLLQNDKKLKKERDKNRKLLMKLRSQENAAWLGASNTSVVVNNSGE